MAAQRRAEYYRDTVTPRRETIYESTLLQYSAMLLGAYELFETRAHQLEAREEQAEAMRDHRIARANLEMSVGGRLPE